MAQRETLVLRAWKAVGSNLGLEDWYPQAFRCSPQKWGNTASRHIFTNLLPTNNLIIGPYTV
jgi:hypothetical protein